MTSAQRHSDLRRWPLHPHPLPGGALSSWLGRTARLYGLSVEQSLRYNLGPASRLLADQDSDDLDWDPPLPVLEALASRTGATVGVLRSMTIGGWLP